jgi:superfamily II DNA or RNA helicase
MEFQYGGRAYDAESGTRATIKSTPRRLFQYDSTGFLLCQKGFYPRVRGMLEARGFTVTYVDRDTPKADEIYTAQWDRVLERFELRPQQLECLQQVDMHDYGQIIAPPAFGKTFMMAMIAVLYPRAKIDIVTKRKDVVATIVSTLTRWVPRVAQFGGGKRESGRVTVFTADSLHHSNYNADIVLCDEVHELMTDRLAERLGNYWYSRNYAFTATPGMRLDNAYHRAEGMFGPKIFQMTQQQAEAFELVAPVIVQWIDVSLPTNPAAGMSTPVARKRSGLWRNDGRNQVIAASAREFCSAGLQTLILVDTVDHALQLRKHLPEAALCYSEGALDGSQNAAKRARYIRQGLLGSDECMTTQRRVALRTAFERRELMLAIATGVWAVGVSFNSLNVLMRADAGDSETANVQLPGRVCRTDAATGKECGILVDFWDSWDTGFRDRSTHRRRDYHKRGWTQYLPTGQLWQPGTRQGHL